MQNNEDEYRAAASDCLELARLTKDPEKKRTLLSMAQRWIKLAYVRHADYFEKLLKDFNDRQMIGRK